MKCDDCNTVTARPGIIVRCEECAVEIPSSLDKQPTAELSAKQAEMSTPCPITMRELLTANWREFTKTDWYGFAGADPAKNPLITELTAPGFAGQAIWQDDFIEVYQYGDPDNRLWHINLSGDYYGEV